MALETVYEFCNLLPRIMSGRKHFNAAFITYNNIPDYTDGFVNTGKDDLSILVSTGDLFYSNETVFRLLLGDPAGCDMMDAEGQSAQRQMELKVGGNLTNGSGLDLLVAYAGISAFDQAVKFAATIRHSNPNVIVVIVTCDCDQTRKDRELSNMIAAGTINHAVVDPECGGRTPMRKILERVIELWPIPLIATAYVC